MRTFLSPFDAALLSRIQDAVVFLDRDHRILGVSEPFLSWTGFSSGQVVGTPVEGYWEEKARWTDWMTGLRLAAEARDHETLDLRTQAGDLIPVEVHLTPLPGKWAGPRHALVLHDLRPQRQMEFLLRQDALTGVAARATLLPRLEEELARVAQYGISLGLLLFDVDGFAELNRRWGPGFGDEVLRVAGAELREASKAPRFAGRWGSDEFLILLPQASREETLVVAEGLRMGLNRRLFLPQGVETSVTASLGAAVAVAHGHDTSASLVARATLGLDRARSLGGHRVEFSS